jgi:hypothetical protein
LAEAEQALSAVPALEAEVERHREIADDMSGELTGARDERDRALARAERADAVLRDVFGSPSWRLTAPLRAAKRLVRGRR